MPSKGDACYIKLIKQDAALCKIINEHCKWTMKNILVGDFERRRMSLLLFGLFVISNEFKR